MPDTDTVPVPSEADDALAYEWIMRCGRADFETLFEAFAALAATIRTEAAHAAKAEQREADAKIAEQQVEQYHEGMSGVDVRLSNSRVPKWKDGPAIAAAIRKGQP